MSYDYGREEKSKKGLYVVLAVVLIIVLVLVIAFFVFFKRVDPGNVGVLVDYGAGTTSGQPVISAVQPGRFIFVKPLQRLAEYPVKQQSLALVGLVENNEVVGGDAAKCSDSGGIPLWINTTVLWRVDSNNVGNLYLLKPGYKLDIDNDENEADDNDIEQAIVLQKTIGAITDACGEFIYTDIFGVERTEFRNRVYELLEPSLAQSYIILDDFIMGEINSTKDIEASLSTKSTAQQQSQAALFQAEQARTVAKGEADAAILSAEGEADSAVLRAKGQAESITIQAEARAQAIQMLADELEKHGISLIDWNWLETWNGKLPATLVISDDIGSPLMTIDIAPTPEMPVQNLEIPVPTSEK